MEAQRNRSLWWGAAALVLLLVFGGVVAADEAATIRDTCSSLMSGSSSLEQTHKDVMVLVETLGQMAERTKTVPPGAREKIREAVKAFREDPSLSGPGAAALHSAWKEYSSGRAYSFPEGVKDRPTITKAIQDRVDSCLGAMAKDDGAQAVKDLLEALLMILTPIPAHSTEPG